MLEEKIEIDEKWLHSLRHSVIDPLIEHPENLDALCRYVASNPVSLSYINKRLYRLASLQSKLTEAHLKQCEMLLEAGADPNYIYGEKDHATHQSILQAAAGEGHFTLIKILLTRGAKADLYVARKWKQQNNNLTEKERLADLTGRRKLPIQIAIDSFKNHNKYKDNDMINSCKSLSEATLSALGIQDTLKQSLNSLYFRLLEKISKSHHDAISSNKQLIIAIGESHSGTVSLIMELMALQISRQLGISLCLFEHNKYIERNVQLLGRMPTNEDKWQTALTINEQLKTLGMQSKAVDLGHWGAKKTGDGYDDYENLESQRDNFNNERPEGIRYRNQVMHDVILSGIKEHSVLIVGSGHLQGMLEEIPFPDNICTLAINTVYDVTKVAPRGSDSDPQFWNNLRFFLSKDHVIKPEEQIEKMSEFLDPASAVQYVNEIHEQYLCKERLSTSHL